MTKEVIVTISPSGEAKVEVKGHAGSGCKELTRQLETALGETVSDTKTSEYYQADRTTQRRRLTT